jgi:MoaA/NifB/PqqE/SkfB family radical SAM enzyme
MAAMRKRAAAEGFPLHGTLALTHRCNLRCIHCFILPNAKPPESELSTAEWLTLAQEAADAGCCSMLLTGGEPLVRNDFAEIYLGIRKMGIRVELFTNATRIDSRVVETLCSAPPILIEVTVYGATPETYRRVTGRAEAHAEAMRGISMLREAGLPVRLKTVLMQENRNDFEAIRALGANDVLPVRYDATVQMRFRGDTQAAQLRVPPQDVARLESRFVPEIVDQFREQQKRTPPGMVKLYACAAGAVSFYANAEGLIQPCGSAVRHGVRYERGGLLRAFRACRQSIRSVQTPVNYECGTCEDRVYCGSCPPIADLECGDEAGKCAYACALAHERGRRMAAEPKL